MKLRNLLLTAALFLTAGIAFAKQSVDVPDFQSTPREESATSINIAVFALNDSWDYALVGYDNEKVKSQETELVKSEGTFIANKGSVGKLISEQLTDLPANVADALKKHTISVYQFTVPIEEATQTIGLKGGEGNGNTAYSGDTATNGNMFWSISDSVAGGQLVFFGKSNFLKNYNNGAMIVVGGKELEPVGSPLPAPVVTLLIALAFGAAFVMYRNRRMQVKA